jgi:hypothetical protein
MASKQEPKQQINAKHRPELNRSNRYRCSGKKWNEASIPERHARPNNQTIKPKNDTQ